MKKIIAFVMALAIITPVNAAGNGYSSGSFQHTDDLENTIHNGVTYPYVHSFCYDGDGLGVMFYTPARVIRQHSSVKGVFRTFSHGLDTNYSSAVTHWPLSGTSYAISVFSQYDDPTGIVSGYASITIPGNPDFTSDIRINFKP